VDYAGLIHPTVLPTAPNDYKRQLKKSHTEKQKASIWFAIKIF
jgi:hypothetical protein